MLPSLRGVCEDNLCSLGRFTNPVLLERAIGLQQLPVAEADIEG